MRCDRPLGAGSDMGEKRILPKQKNIHNLPGSQTPDYSYLLAALSLFLFPAPITLTPPALKLARLSQTTWFISPKVLPHIALCTRFFLGLLSECCSCFFPCKVGVRPGLSWKHNGPQGWWVELLVWGWVVFAGQAVAVRGRMDTIIQLRTKHSRSVKYHKSARRGVGGGI